MFRASSRSLSDAVLAVAASMLLSASAARAQQPQVVTSPVNINAGLATTDRKANDRYLDEYHYQGRRGEHLQVTMRSTAFNARLRLTSASGALVAENDDYGRSMNPRISETLPANGWYVIRATSSRPNVTGSYTLGIASDRDPRNGPNPFPPPPVPPPPAPPPLTRAEVEGGWTFEESLGAPNTSYYCNNYGLMWMETQGATFRVRLEQNGECTIAGSALNSAGLFSSTTAPLIQEGLPPRSIRFTIETCVYIGELSSSRRLSGTVRCTVRKPGGSEVAVAGTWYAWRDD
jgi:hypothetical protein